MKWIIAVAVTVALVVVVLLDTTTNLFVSAAAPPAAADCAPAPTAGVTVTAAGLTAVQLGNAATIVKIGEQIPGVGVPGETIAVATSLVEADLENLTYGTGDSHGLFQQQWDEGWGTIAQTENPTYAAGVFYEHLLAVPAFRTIPVEGTARWEAAWGAVAQDVQRSGYPLRYEGQMDLAAELVGSAQTGAAVTLDNCVETTSAPVPDRAQLPASVVAQIAAAPGVVRIAIEFALSKVGDWYQWGAAGPTRYDCSGLTQAAYAAAGVSIDRTTYSQVTDGAPVTQTGLETGDLVLPDPGHVQLFLGRDSSGVGWVVEAPHTGAQIRVLPLWGFWAARRIV